MENVEEQTLNTRDVEQPLSAEEFVAELRRLADCIEQGKPIEIEVAGEKVVVPKTAKFSIEHEREEDEEEIEFQMKWSLDESAEGRES